MNTERGIKINNILNKITEVQLNGNYIPWYIPDNITNSLDNLDNTGKQDLIELLKSKKEELMDNFTFFKENWWAKYSRYLWDIVDMLSADNLKQKSINIDTEINVVNSINIDTSNKYKTERVPKEEKKTHSRLNLKNHQSKLMLNAKEIQARKDLFAKKKAEKLEKEKQKRLQRKQLEEQELAKINEILNEKISSIKNLLKISIQKIQAKIDKKEESKTINDFTLEELKLIEKLFENQWFKELPKNTFNRLKRLIDKHISIYKHMKLDKAELWINRWFYLWDLKDLLKQL